jgi:hypothetical protein
LDAGFVVCAGIPVQILALIVFLVRSGKIL